MRYHIFLSFRPHHYNYFYEIIHASHTIAMLLSLACSERFNPVRLRRFKVMSPIAKYFTPLNPALDEEAIRLVKNSGAWPPAAGPKEGNAAYRLREKIEFKLDE